MQAFGRDRIDVPPWAVNQKPVVRIRPAHYNGTGDMPKARRWTGVTAMGSVGWHREIKSKNDPKNLCIHVLLREFFGFPPSYNR